MSRGRVHISFPERCKGCGLCVHFCPQEVLVISGERNVQGYRIVGLKVPEKCTGCGLCYLICPDVVLEVK